MRITVIGHWGGIPKAGEATAGYLFQEEGYNLLVDCGSAVVSNLQRFLAIEDLDGVVLSHYHFDHFCDVGTLVYGRQILTRIGRLSKVLLIHGHAEDIHFQELTKEPYAQGIAYRQEETLELGPFRIEFLKTEHPVPCFAMRITAGGVSVVYSADTAYFQGLADFAKEADLCMLECTLYPGVDGKEMGHMNSTDAAKLAKEAGARELLLTHLPVYGDTARLLEDAAKHYEGKTSLASMGWTWEKGKRTEVSQDDTQG